MTADGEAPRWWPAGRPWPPKDGQDWRRAGRRMARRAGCALAVILLVTGGLGTALVWLVLSALGVIGSAPFARAAAGAGLLLGVAAVVLAAVVLRRLAAGVGSLVAAAGRVEAGDYSARVHARGPSELRSLARAFNAMSSRLEAEETRRRSVLADVAHELRTPLTVIRGQAEGVADGIYPAGAESMGPILSATGTLEVLLDDLRTLVLAETGGLRLRREPVELAVLVNETLDTLRPTASARRVTLVERVAHGTPAVDADPARLRGALANLLTNAIRHAPGGTVTVSAEGDTGGMCTLSVADDGAGIPTELLPRIFDRFVKGPGSDGTGLGLAIVRDIVEAHGGQVSAESGATTGTTVRLRLPVAAPEPDVTSR